MVMRKGLPAKLALTDADDTRYVLKGLVVQNADGSPRGGVTGPVNTNLVTGTATMNVAVGAFTAVAVRDSGVVLLANDGTTNVLVGTAPVTNSRIDLICARQNDASATVSAPDANNTPLLYVVAGTAAPSPTAPALPAGSVEVGRITVSAGNATTNAAVITQTGTYTASLGGAVPFRTKAALDLWTNPALRQSAVVLADSTAFRNGVYVHDGTAWRSESFVVIEQAFNVAGGTPVHVNNAFTDPRFREFRVEIRFDATGGTSDANFQARNAGVTDAGASSYSYYRNQTLAGANDPTGSSATSSIKLGRFDAARGGSQAFIVNNPNVAKPTFLTHGSARDSVFGSVFDGTYLTAAAHDGFTITSGVAMIGTVTVTGIE